MATEKEMAVIEAARALVSLPWGTPVGDMIPAMQRIALAVIDLDG